MPPDALPPALALLPLLAACGWAAVVDVRTRRIPNALCLAVLVAGVAAAVAGRGVVTPGQSGLGLLVGFGLLVVPYALGATGGGDVKLVAAIGAWLGPGGVLAVVLVASVAGAAMAVAQCAATGRLALLCRNTATIAVNLANVRRLGVDHVSATGRSLRSVDRPMPKAVPLLVGVAAVVASM